MAIINLDEGEEIDTLTINGRPYEVGLIPTAILSKLSTMKIDTGLQPMLDQWRSICKEILEVRNDEVNMEAISDQKLTALIKYILDKVQIQK